MCEFTLSATFLATSLIWLRDQKLSQEAEQEDGLVSGSPVHQVQVQMQPQLS